MSKKFDYNDQDDLNLKMMIPYHTIHVIWYFGLESDTFLSNSFPENVWPMIYSIWFLAYMLSMIIYRMKINGERYLLRSIHFISLLLLLESINLF